MIGYITSESDCVAFVLPAVSVLSSLQWMSVTVDRLGHAHIEITNKEGRIAGDMNSHMCAGQAHGRYNHWCIQVFTLRLLDNAVVLMWETYAPCNILMPMEPGGVAVISHRRNC